MLSPYATKRVAPIRGGGFTVTVNEHLSARLWASVTMHVTTVDPIGKLSVLAGAQRMESGGAPPATLASGYVTASVTPSSDCAVNDGGHVIFGGPGMTGVGCAGVRPQAAAHNTATHSA
jgi:hypothetical protein